MHQNTLALLAQVVPRFPAADSSAAQHREEYTSLSLSLFHDSQTIFDDEMWRAGVRCRVMSRTREDRRGRFHEAHVSTHLRDAYGSAA